MQFSSESGSRRVPSGAFTLIELLVVIAIIAVLASLLLPALARAKAQGRKAVCISNYRQMQIAWQLYINDEADRLPDNDAAEDVGKDRSRPNWVAGSMNVLDNWLDNTNSYWLIKSFGGIGRYLGASGVFKCPSDKSLARISGRLHSRVRSVSMNFYMGAAPQGRADFAGRTDYVYKRSSDFVNLPPAGGFVLIDAHEDSITGGAFGLARTPTLPNTWWLDFPGGRHNRAAVLSFTDGHVEAHKWLDPRTTRAATGTYLWGEQQENNRDIVWLHERGFRLKNP
jgi:prepilin-type N-terminal cleavage/methylation domain-containing protein/prepilin-type processing-associated H-X9-DG protein